MKYLPRFLPASLTILERNSGNDNNNAIKEMKAKLNKTTN